MSANAVDTVESFYAAIGDGDMTTIMTTLDGVAWYEHPAMPYARQDGEPYVGGEQVTGNVLGPLTTAVPDLGLGDLHVLDLGDTVAAIGTYTGTVTPSGATVNLPFVHLWRFDGYRLAEFRQLTDGAAFAAALNG